jgi:hypothetical protein
MIKMNRKLTIALSLLVLLGFSLVTQAFAQTRVPGVTPDDYFTYTITTLWSSTNIGATVPSDLLENNNTIYNCTILDVVGSNVTANDIWHFNNGTDSNAIVIQNVDSGTSFLMNGLITIAGANLGQNDMLFSSVNDPRKINQTTSIDYGNSKRDTNAVVFNYPGFGAESLYFDKATGMLAARVEYSINSEENASIIIVLIDTNRWLITAYPQIVSPTSSPPTSDPGQVFGITLSTPIIVAIITVIIVAAVAAPLVLYRTRKNRKKKHRR